MRWLEDPPAQPAALLAQAGRQAGGRAATAKLPHMPASLPQLDGLERVLLRRGVGALEADRSRCVECGRTPLTGEQVHLYEGRRGGVVCELCRPLRDQAPAATELVRHCEHGHTVRLTARAA